MARGSAGPKLARGRLALVVTSPLTARILLRGQLGYLRERGFDVTVICDPRPSSLLDRVRAEEGVRVETVPMRREIAPLADLHSLVRLVIALRRLRPHAVNAGTPKAGALGTLAAWIARVPRRCYTLRGLRLETARGWRRALLLAAERVASGLAHRVVCVSPSLARRYESLGLGTGKLEVLATGSSNGVEIERFARPTEPDRGLREELGIPAQATVFGFVGRLTRDKGVVDLVRAFAGLEGLRPAPWLLLLGDFESGDALADADVAAIADHPRIVHRPHVDEPAPYYWTMDAAVLPSYREGLPNVVLEAAAAGLPTVGYASTGVVDAVVDGETGLLAPTGDIAALGELLARYAGDEALRARHGRAALERVRRSFRRERVWEAWAAFYDRLASVE